MRSWAIKFKQQYIVNSFGDVGRLNEAKLYRTKKEAQDCCEDIYDRVVAVEIKSVGKK